MMQSQSDPNFSSYATDVDPVVDPVVVEPVDGLQSSPTSYAYPTNSYSKGYSAANQAFQRLRQFFDQMGGIFKQNQQLLSTITVLLVALIALRIVFAIIGTLNDIPLLTSLFELIGLGYTVWFVNRYLLRASDRQQLTEQFQEMKSQFIGDEPIFSGQSQSAGQSQQSSGLDVKKSVVVQRSPQELYQFWRNFENLPQIMHHLESVTSLDERRSHWVAKAPLGTQVEWDAEIIAEESPRTIVWRSLPNSDVETVGSVAFTETGNGATEVKVTMEYNPPAGALGAAVAAALGENPEQQLEEDLSRFKQVMESSQ